MASAHRGFTVSLKLIGEHVCENPAWKNGYANNPRQDHTGGQKEDHPQREHLKRNFIRSWVFGQAIFQPIL